jgi:uncharacterized protein with GYD domain
MAKYLIQGAYTAEAWAAQIGSSTDRLGAVGEMMASIGVTFEHYWYSFGDYDFVIIADGPSNVETAGAVLAAAAGGAVRALKTTPLLTVEEGIAALRKAGDVEYRPPAAS